MIRIIDNVRYLPKDKRNVLIPENEIYNKAYKAIITNIKKELSRINAVGKSATVTISGKVKKGNNRDINITTECQDAELHEKITKILN